MILLITAIILGLFWFGYLIFRVIRLNKVSSIGGEKFVFSRELLVNFLPIILSQGLLTIASSYGLVLNGGWVLKAYEHILLIFGSYFLGTGFALGTSAFLVRYYHITVEEKDRTRLKHYLLIGVSAIVIGVYLLTTGIADHLKYPLANGISFSNGITYFDPGYERGILWYGILIVGGTFLAYCVADHIVYKKYHQHGLFESIALVGFFSGIIGARLWSCLVLDFDMYRNDLLGIFRIWEGGLAIQGGIFLGCAVTIPFILLKKKNINARYVIDVALPCIIIAQAIGRWGNFFNQEVYGVAVSSDVMKIFPKIISNNMFIKGEYHLPLFFIECITNLTGFFVLRYAIGRGLKKYIGLGDIGASYIIWYGLTRVALEPLRVGFTLEGHDDGFGYLQSWIIAFVMVALGILLIVVFHLYDHWRKKKGLPPKTLETI